MEFLTKLLGIATAVAETTTTTGSGEAKGDLKEKVEEVPKEEINLDKELGKKPDISWNVEKGADAVNGYKVEEVTNSEDGNRQTLKLKKEKETTAEMTAEDIAKLVDAEKPTVNPDGTYTVRLCIRDDSGEQMAIQLLVMTLRQCRVLEDQFRRRAEPIYQDLLLLLSGAAPQVE